MNRDLWKQYFTVKNMSPSWPCTVCKNGRLFIDEGNLYKVETNKSQVEHQHPDWEPSWIQGYFSCQFKCIDCTEIHIAAGNYSVEPNFDCEENSPTYIEVYELKLFMEAPPIINLPNSLPLNIRKEIQRSFHLYWVDRPACANSIRTCIELLLTHQKIKRIEITRKRKRRVLSLHSRIELFREKHTDLGNSLLAAKWIGNAGSHPEHLNREDILDSYEIIEHVLDQLFKQKAKRIAQLSREVNHRRKPRSVR